MENFANQNKFTFHSYGRELLDDEGGMTPEEWKELEKFSDMKRAEALKRAEEAAKAQGTVANEPGLV